MESGKSILGVPISFVDSVKERVLFGAATDNVKPDKYMELKPANGENVDF